MFGAEITSGFVPVSASAVNCDEFAVFVGASDPLQPMTPAVESAAKTHSDFRSGQEFVMDGCPIMYSGLIRETQELVSEWESSPSDCVNGISPIL